MFLHRLFSAIGLVAVALALSAPSAARADLTPPDVDDLVRVGSRCEVYVNDKRMTPYLCYGP